MNWKLWALMLLLLSVGNTFVVAAVCDYLPSQRIPLAAYVGGLLLGTIYGLLVPIKFD